MISTEELLKPISPEQPCGPDFTYQPSFQALETLIRGKPETQFSPAEDPDWKELKTLSTNFFGQSKHLTAGVILAVTLLKTDGFSGLREGLGVIRGLLDRYWNEVYPRLDPEDNNDPTERINILSNLCSYGDPYRFIPRLQQAPVCVARSMGRITLGDILAAKDRATAPPAEGGETPQKTGPTSAQIEAAFRDSDPEALKGNFQAVSDAVEIIKAMDQFLSTTLGSGSGVNFEELVNNLTQIRKSLAPFVEGASVEGAEEEAQGEATSDGAASRRSGKIQSRDDVVSVLDQICNYYRQYEPSSPIPFIIRRAQRMVKMDFMQIITELTPDAMANVKVITGQDGDSAPPSQSSE